MPKLALFWLPCDLAVERCSARSFTRDGLNAPYIPYFEGIHTERPAEREYYDERVDCGKRYVPVPAPTPATMLKKLLAAAMLLDVR
jgi:hypothetical protein